MQPGPRQEYGEPFTGRDCTVFDPGALTKATRKFGKLPDMSSWRPADVVLFSPCGNITAITDFVRIVQRERGFSPRDCIWTHAALYVGDGKVVHVNRNDAKLGNNVGIADVSDFVEQSHFRVRSRKQLSDDERAAIVACAKRMIADEKTYSTLKAFTFALSSFRIIKEKYETSDELFNGIVCSDVVSSAYDEVIPGLPVFATITHQAALPATLSASTFLEDIEVTWCVIPGRTSARAGLSSS